MWYSNTTPTKLRSEEADALFTKSMSMSPYSMHQSMSTIKCENCEDGVAVIHCITCDGSLCHACDASCHVSRLMQKHVRGPLQELRTVKCAAHGEVMKLYCNQCSQLVCRDCSDFGEHKGHNVNLLNKVAEKQRSELRSLMSQACIIVSQLTSVAQQVSHTIHYLGIEQVHNLEREEEARSITLTTAAGEIRRIVSGEPSDDGNSDVTEVSMIQRSFTDEDNSSMEPTLNEAKKKIAKGTFGEGLDMINSHFDRILADVEARRVELLSELKALTKEKATALGAQAYALNTIIQRCNEAIDRCRIAIKANDNGVAAAFLTVRDSLEQAIAIDMSLHIQPVADSHMCILLPDNAIEFIRNHGSVGGPGTPKGVKMELKNNFVELTWVSGNQKNNNASKETYVIQQTVHPDTNDAVPIVTEIGRTKPDVCTYSVDVSGLNSKRLSYRIKAIDAVGNCSFLSVAVDIIIPDILSHQLQYEYPFDENGLFYYIGTVGGTRPYQNPHNSGDVVAALSNSGGFLSSHPHKFVGRVPDGFNFTSDESESWMGVDIGPKRRLIPNYYCIRTDQCPRKMMNWELQAMVGGDMGEWVTLRRHENDTSLEDEPHSVAAWPIPVKDDTPYRYFRIFQFGKNSSNTHHLACCGMELYGSFVELQ